MVDSLTLFDSPNHQPELHSPTHAQSAMDSSSISSSAVDHIIPVATSTSSGDNVNGLPYTLRKRTGSLILSSPSPVLRRKARRVATKQRTHHSTAGQPTTVPNSKKYKKNIDQKITNKKNKISSSKDGIALKSVAILPSVSQDKDVYSYYSPHKIQQNIEIEEQENFQSRQPKLQNNDDDFSKPHWNAIRSFDITQTIGKYPTYKFKKLYSVGTQLGFIYDNITQKLVKYSPESPHNNTDAFELYLKLWVLFSPLFLRVSKSSSKSIIKHRVKQYKSYQWGLMLDELCNDCKGLNKPLLRHRRKSYKGDIPIGERSPESRYETAAVNFDDKNISKAYQTIVHPSSASNAVSSESIQALRDLHPKMQDPNRLPEALLAAARKINLPPLSTPQKLWKIIRNLRNGTAPGLDDLRSEHLVSMARHGKAQWISNMSIIVNLALASSLPTWLNDMFAYSKLIGLVKQSEENKKLKLRPIGIGMVWPKIISKSILNHYLPHVKDFFELFQFGLSKSGLESITHKTKEALRQHPNWVLLRLDLVNAFHSI